MDTEELRKYLLCIATAGYADSKQERQWVREPDRSTTIAHAEGPWRLHDNFFGGEPYGGREVVFYEQNPVWIMVYYGDVATTVTDVKAVYSCLQGALGNADESLPLRGPRSFSQDGMEYTTSLSGDILRFSGVEHIWRDGEEIYSGIYAGGLINRRSE